MIPDGIYDSHNTQFPTTMIGKSTGNEIPDISYIQVQDGEIIVGLERPYHKLPFKMFPAYNEAYILRIYDNKGDMHQMVILVHSEDHPSFEHIRYYAKEVVHV